MAEPPLRSPSELSYCVAATEQQHNRGSNTVFYCLRLNCNSKGALNVYFSLFQGDFLIFGARSVSHSISVGTVIWQLTPENHFPSPLNFRPPTFLCQRPYTTPSRTGSLASPCFSHDSALFDGLVHDHFFVNGLHPNQKVTHFGASTGCLGIPAKILPWFVRFSYGETPNSPAASC